MLEILAIVIIVLLIIVICLLVFKKVNNDNDNISQTLQQHQGSMTLINKQMNDIFGKLGELENMSKTTNKDITQNIQNLNDILGNVKKRGTFAEVQLEKILDMAIPGMYEKNVKPNPRSNKIVEFAIKIPAAEQGKIIYLPIDSKFPLDRYQKFVNAAKSSDSAYVEKMRKDLISAISMQATVIKDSYISASYTTPFAIMYLATEGLYLEAVNDKNGLLEKLHRKGILLAGPSTIIALSNSLAIGFNSIKMNNKAKEITKVLLKTKQDLEKLNKNLSAIDKCLLYVQNALSEATNRTKIIDQNLQKIESNDTF